MSAERPSVVARLAGASSREELAAGFEEEGVPLRVEPGSGDALALARAAAHDSALGLGVGGDGSRLVLVLAAASGWPYLEAPTERARLFGRAVARIAARRPLGPGLP